MSKKYTFQYKVTISVNREGLLNNVVRNKNLSKKDLRVFLHLMTHLDYATPKEISKKQIALDLNMRKEDVAEAIESLICEGIMINESSPSVSNGYRLLF